MSAGIDMLHHYGPLNRSKNATAQNMVDSSATGTTFDFTRFRRHFATLFDRIVKLASSDKAPAEDNTKHKFKKQNSKEITQETEEAPQAAALEAVENWHDVLNVKPMLSATGAVRRLKPYQKKPSTLEAVEDDDEEEAEEDEEDLRKMGYKKEYGCKDTKEESEWLNEDFKLPSSDELFNDLGIWW